MPARRGRSGGGRSGLASVAVASFLALGTALVACNAREAILGCRGTEACKVEGRCAMSRFAAGDALARCYAVDAADCRASTRCAERGLCDHDPEVVYGLGPGQCRALTFASCVESERCRAEGACTPNAGACEISEWGCRRSDACVREGRCTAAGGGCVAGGGKDEPPCQRACRSEGACTAEGPRCVATRNEDCESSAVCNDAGRCTLDASLGVCVARDEGRCRESVGCSSPNRRCRTKPGLDICYRIEPTCDRACSRRGRCEARDLVCAATREEDCRASVACVIAGACHFEARTASCVATSQGDCDEALACKAFGPCTWAARERRCVRGGAAVETTDCDLASPPERSSDACDLEGRCLPTPEGRCVTPESVGLPPWRPRPRRGAPPAPLPRERAGADGASIATATTTVPTGTAAPSEQNAERDARAEAKALLDALEPDLAELLDRIDAMTSRWASQKSQDSPNSPFVRVESPARGTRLASRDDVLEVGTLSTPRPTLVVRTLRGGHPDLPPTTATLAIEVRGRERRHVTCPSSLADGPDVADVVAYRGFGERASIGIAVAVSRAGICSAIERDHARGARRDALRAFVAGRERAYFDYAEEVLRACRKPVSREPAPGALAAQDGFLTVRSSCRLGDSGLHRSWAQTTMGPDARGAGREIGSYRPEAKKRISWTSFDDTMRLTIELTAGDGDEVTSQFLFEKRVAPTVP